MSFRKVWDIVLIIFSVYWVVFFLLDYWDKHPAHVIAFQHFKYFNLSVFILLLGGGLSYLLANHKKKWMQYITNGVGAYLLGILIVTAIIISFKKYANLELDASNYLHLYGRLTYTFLSVYFIVLACYSAGNAILKRYYYPDVIKHAHFTYDFALGAVILTMLLFLIGAVGQLKAFVVFPILFLFIGINWRGSLNFLKSTFITNLLPKKKIGFWAYFILYLLFAFLVLNFLAIDIPFPSGFDSRNEYVNISQLVAQNEGIIKGFPPYNWSLLMSLGYIAFDRPETTLLLAYLPIVLTLLLAYSFFKKNLKMSALYTSLSLLLFAVTPAVANQMFVELKTDFALLFFQFISISLLVSWAKRKIDSGDLESLKLNTPEFKLFAILGLFIGFGIGIKLLNLFIVFAILIAMWGIRGKFIGTVGLSILLFAAILILKLNTISGLEDLHLGTDWLKWILVLVGISLLMFAIKDERTQFLTYMKNVITIGSFSLIPLIPWLVKNYSETKSLSPLTLLKGELPSPEMSYDILKNLEDGQ